MSETARMLDDMADRLLSGFIDGQQGVRDEAALSASLLEAATESGLPLALTSEEDGGLGATLAEASVIAWQWGRHAAPLPIVELLLSGRLRQDIAAEIQEGSAALGLLGSKRIVAACSGPVETIHAVDAATGALVSHDGSGAGLSHGLAGEATLQLDIAGSTERGRTELSDASRNIAIDGALLTAAAMVGAMGKALDIAIEHANTRKQFGRPLAKFQAIQNMLAEAASEHVVAQAALTAAITARDAGQPGDLLWLSAKAQAGRAASIVSAAAHQVMGAIGFTEEHVLHHYTKRLWAWRDKWGRQADCEQAIGNGACADGRGLWVYIVDNGARAA